MADWKKMTNIEDRLCWGGLGPAFKPAISAFPRVQAGGFWRLCRPEGDSPLRACPGQTECCSTCPNTAANGNQVGTSKGLDMGGCQGQSKPIFSFSFLLRKRGEEFGGGHHADPAVKDIVLSFHVDLIEMGDSEPFSEIPQRRAWGARLHLALHGERRLFLKGHEEVHLVRRDFARVVFPT